MYRLVMLLAVLIALVAAGCGGSDDDSDSAPSAVAKAPDSAPSGDTGDPGSRASEKKKDDASERSSDDEDEEEAEDDDEPKSERELHEEQEEAFQELAPDRQLLLVKTVVRAALLRFGLRMVDVELGNGGRKVTAVVGRKGACNFVASQEPNLTLAITESAPGVKSVRYEMAGTGQELGYYVVGCKKPEIPSGAGRVVLDHSGVGGPYTSKRFEIKSKRWALEWVNEAASLAVIVVPVSGESKDEYFKPVGSRKRESGRYEYKGRGTFQIKAYGSAGWRVRVKEIG